MRTITNELKKRMIDFNKLQEYGFIKANNQYWLKEKICNDKFEISIIIKENKMFSKVIELENNEEYILVDVKSSNGEFVGKVKEEYENKINDVIDKCTFLEVFKTNQAKKIISYIKDKYNDQLEFLWKKFDDNAIWRNKKNNKWYGLLLTVTANKLGIESNSQVEIIDLRYQKENIKNIINNKTIFPGYHMNKDNWITIVLNESVEIKKIFELIDNSYNISLEK